LGGISIAAGEATPPGRLLTGPASPRRSVCAPGADVIFTLADRLASGNPHHESHAKDRTSGQPPAHPAESRTET
jgi:hypothetical protein